LLLSCSVARLWCWSSFLGTPGFPFIAGQTLSVALWLGSLAALVALAGRLGAPGVAPLAGLAFLALGWDLQWGALQYSDYAQATWLTWGGGGLALVLRRPACAERWWPLIGFVAGSSAWCKNEGLAFAAVLLVAVFVIARARSARAWARIVAGALVPALAVAVLKLGFAGTSSVFAARERTVLADLLDPERYVVLATSVVEHVRESWSLAALAVLALALGLLPRRPRARAVWSPLILGAVLALVFALVLLTTRERYDWHIGTAAGRLLLQVWPLAVLSIVTVVRPR
jgi:hypothetical protein